MAVTTGGGIGYDQAAESRANRGQLLQAQQALQQQGQFQQQQALQAGVQKYYQLEKEREAWVAGGGDMNTFTAKNAPLFGEVQQLFSAATGKPLSMGQALQAGFGALSEFARANETLKSKVHADLQNPFGAGGGATVVPPIGKGGASVVPSPAQSTPMVAPSVRVDSEREGGGAIEGGLIPAGKKAVYMGLWTKPGSSREGRYQVRVQVDGKDQLVFVPDSIPEGRALAYARDELLRSGIIQSAADMNLPGDTTVPARAPDTTPVPGALGGRAPTIDQTNSPVQQWTLSLPTSALPSDNTYAQAQQSVADTESPYSWARSLATQPPVSQVMMDQEAQSAGPSLAGESYGTRLPGGTIGAPQFAEGIAKVMPGMTPKATDKLFKIITPSLEAKPSDTPKVDDKAIVKNAGVIDKALTGAKAVTDSIIASAVARSPGTDMVPLTQREVTQVKKATERIMLESEKLAAGTPEARRAAYLAAKNYVETARPEELEAAGLSAVADRRQAVMLTQMQLTGAMTAAQAKAGSKEAVALIEMRAKAMEQAIKLIDTATTAAKNDPNMKGDLTKFLAANPYYTRMLSMWSSAAAGQEVSSDMIMKDPNAFAKFFGGKPTASGLGLTAGGNAPTATIDQASIDAAIRALSQ